jgi:hypothetical protein
MKYNLFAFGLISVLAGLASSQASLAQDLSASYTVNLVSPSDASPAAAAIKSRIEARGYGDVEDLARDRSGVWHAHVIRNKVEIAVSVDKGGRITAQPANEQLAARCSRLYGIASRYVSGGAGADGSLGPNMGVIGAGLDCQKGRHDEGIKALEKILNSQHISYPPG